MRIAAMALRLVRLLELRRRDEQVRRSLEARNLAAHLLQYPTQLPPFVKHTKAQLLDDVSKIATVSAEVRRETAELIEDFYTPQEEAWQFGSHAESLIRHADKPETDYEEGLKWSEAAYERDPKTWAFEYGMALYRNGRYGEALETVENSHADLIERFPAHGSAFLAVKAMAQFRLGMKQAALESLAAAEADRYVNFPDNLELTREAKSLIQPDHRGEDEKRPSAGQSE
jgi:hypothetical protein